MNLVDYNQTRQLAALERMGADIGQQHRRPYDNLIAVSDVRPMDPGIWLSISQAIGSDITQMVCHFLDLPDSVITEFVWNDFDHERSSKLCTDNGTIQACFLSAVSHGLWNSNVACKSFASDTMATVLTCSVDMTVKECKIHVTVRCEKRYDDEDRQIMLQLDKTHDDHLHWRFRDGTNEWELDGRSCCTSPDTPSTSVPDITANMNRWISWMWALLPAEFISQTPTLNMLTECLKDYDSALTQLLITPWP